MNLCSSVFICDENSDLARRVKHGHKFFVAFIPIFVAIDLLAWCRVYGSGWDNPREHGSERVSSPSSQRSVFRLGLCFSEK